jgi:hypothetical protein
VCDAQRHIQPMGMWMVEEVSYGLFVVLVYYMQ